MLVVVLAHWYTTAAFFSLLQVCGIYEVNGFELGVFNSVASIFPTSSMITHNCVPNAGHFENMENGTLEVVSLVDIAANTPITMCYDWCLKVGWNDRSPEKFIK